jgi:D-alanine-D-alanine ligase
MTKLLLIFGGPSAEHEVSLVSAKNIYEVLKKTDIEVTLVGITKNKIWKKIKGEDLLKTSFVSSLDLNLVGEPIELIKKESSLFVHFTDNLNEDLGPFEVAFPVIHGPYGEDGVLQTELSQLGLEFVGTDTLGCENSFDKAKTKNIIAKTDIPQVAYLVFNGERPTFNEIKEKLGTPFFVKPANMGSSVGISKVKTAEQMTLALIEAYKHDKKIIIEKGVVAREIECALLERKGLEASGLGEVKPNHDFYSYEAKYLDPNGADLIIPAQLDQDIANKIKKMAIECFEKLGCRDYSRADFFLTQQNEIYFNEINTHPGFTSISQFPMLWQQEGMIYKDLILQLVSNAESRVKRRMGK